MLRADIETTVDDCLCLLVRLYLTLLFTYLSATLSVYICLSACPFVCICLRVTRHTNTLQRDNWTKCVRIKSCFLCAYNLHASACSFSVIFKTISLPFYLFLRLSGCVFVGSYPSQTSSLYLCLCLCFCVCLCLCLPLRPTV